MTNNEPQQSEANLLLEKRDWGKHPDWENRAYIGALRAIGVLKEADITSAKMTEDVRATIAGLFGKTGKAYHLPENEGHVEEPPEWKEILQLQKYPAAAIASARKKGLPDQFLRQYAFSTIRKEIENQDYGFVVRFMKNMKFGTPEQIAFFEETAREQELRRLAEKERIDDKNATDSVKIVLPRDATMARFFEIWDGMSRAQHSIITDRIWLLPGDGEIIAKFRDTAFDKPLRERLLVTEFFASVDGYEKQIGIEWAA